MQELIPRVTIMAIGVDQYEDDNFRNLYGPQEDINNLHELLVDNDDTALYEENQFLPLINPTAEEFRTAINDFIFSRSADNDILIFYFSGHGLSIGRDDFGFCTKDTKIHPGTGKPLPFSTVKYRDLLNSLNLANIIPVVIIDACYSGIAGDAHFIAPIDALANLRDLTHSKYASNFALLSACSDEYFTEDTPYGGEFSNNLLLTAKQGIETGEVDLSLLSLQAIYQNLSRKLSEVPFNEKPRLYIGTSLPEFPFVKNTKYTLRTYTLSPTYVNIVKELWNEGKPIDMSPKEIGDHLGYASYCNHNKLSFAAWSLLDTIPGTRRRQLTEHGRLFMQGQLSVPHKVIYNPAENDYIRADDARDVSIADYP